LPNSYYNKPVKNLINEDIKQNVTSKIDLPKEC